MNKYYTTLLLLAFLSGCGSDGQNSQEKVTHEVILKAKATLSPLHPKQGDEVTLDAKQSSVSEGKITQWIWSEHGKTLSTKEQFKKVFPVGEHNITLYVDDESGNQASTFILFNVEAIAPAGRWDNIAPLTISGDGKRKLYVTSDADNLYIKVESENNATDAEILLNSDNSNVSGYFSSNWGEGFDYIAKASGLYALATEKEYRQTQVSSVGFTSLDEKSVEFTLDKRVFSYLAEEIPMVVLFKNNAQMNFPAMKPASKFRDTHYDATQPDTVAPVIVLQGDKVVTIGVNTPFSDPGATAIDVREGNVTSTLQVNDSDLDITKPGYYNIFYTAQDSKGNSATEARIVHVTGADAQKEIEVKSLGAMNDKVAIDHQTGLVWDNDDRDQATTRGCIIFGSNRQADSIKNDLEYFCKELIYAGFDDWRVPTSLELSKFYVQMELEGKHPGMARSGCIRNIAIDNNTTPKSVWTYLKPQPGFIEDTPLAPSGGRCVRGAVNNSTGHFEIKSIGADNDDRVIVDTSKNLMWVNESRRSKKACLAIHSTSDTDYNESKTFCANLNFAGFTDWRDPTTAELADFVKETTKAYLLPGYEAPCKRLLATEQNGTRYAVSTRFDSKHAIGTESLLEIPITSNIGLRCVREQ